MGRFIARGSADSFWFPVRLGERLREVRKSRQLTQEQVAVMMGRNGLGNKTIVSRLELGRFSSPSLRVVLDYLRACRAGLDEVRGILMWTRQDPAGREELLANAGAWLAGDSGVTAEQAEAVAREVRDLFGVAERSGDLDWRPTEPAE